MRAGENNMGIFKSHEEKSLQAIRNMISGLKIEEKLVIDMCANEIRTKIKEYGYLGKIACTLVDLENLTEK